MSKDYTNEVGYESLLSDFKRYQKQTPKGITLVKEGQNIYLQFKTTNKNRSKYKCNCTFTVDGIIDAVRKAYKVAEKLKVVDSEVEFWDWYDKEIKQESQLVDDRLTFGEAIAKVEDGFWSSLSRTKRERDKNSKSDQASWRRTYGCFYQHLPQNETVNLRSIQKVIDKQKKGARNYKYVVSAMKKLVRINRRNDLLLELNELDVEQTIFMNLQSINLDEFLMWRDKVLEVTSDKYKDENIGERRSWLWAFSTQIVYGLRISEVFAIKNLFDPYVTKDGVSIPALNSPDNIDNLIYIGDKTILGTSTKTGSRIARPQIPPKYPNLIESLEVKNPLLPTNRPKSEEPETVTYFFPNTARKRLIKWNAPFTQTHADRNLGNINGMQAGIPQEVRSMSLGHTPAQNESGYKKRIGTQTKIDLLLNSNSNAIDFVTALASIKNLLKTQPENRNFAAKLLSIIYQKNEDELLELL